MGDESATGLPEMPKFFDQTSDTVGVVAASAGWAARVGTATTPPTATSAATTPAALRRFALCAVSRRFAAVLSFVVLLLLVQFLSVLFLLVLLLARVLKPMCGDLP
ncbi:hypothetical protein GCM10022256_14040 [Frondihabitans peucedani]|uniref:Transmembrane protein n=1 Tax=Frondihabitans peucedani TaxID=598626 RepID=A0ABP8E0R2_9MICO